MLSYKNRFHGYGGLSYVYKNGQSARNHWFTLKAVRNRRRPQSRLAVVVSKKVLKGAVGRNRIRRRVYEQLRLQLPLISESWDIVCIVSSAEVRDLASPELARLLDNALHELGVKQSS